MAYHKRACPCCQKHIDLEDWTGLWYVLCWKMAYVILLQEEWLLLLDDYTITSKTVIPNLKSFDLDTS